MDFSWTVTVPANTARTNPHVESHRVTFGVIESGSIIIPDGHKGLTGLQIFRGLHKLLPSGPDKFFAGNKVVIPLSPKTKIDDRPYELQSKSWNTDEKHDHDFYIYLSMKTPHNPDGRNAKKKRKRRLKESEITEIVGGM